jgi:hypothetical protein
LTRSPHRLAMTAICAFWPLHRDRWRAGIRQREGSHAANEALSGARGFPSDICRRLVLAKPDINRMSQEVVRRPGQIGDLGDELRLDPMDAGEHERRAEPRNKVSTVELFTWRGLSNPRARCFASRRFTPKLRGAIRLKECGE